MSRSLRIGLSTCPNDIFLFHALLEGEVKAEDLELSFELADVEELNRGLAAGRFDAAKASAYQALALHEELIALPVGWALGRGVGPVVLAAPGRAGRERTGAPRVLCPGAGTTAHLLWRLFHPEPAVLEQRVFSEIPPALLAGEADLGVCIHEARFTWRAAGLELVEDLGETWERETGAPLPLGGLVARRSLDAECVASLVRALGDSLAWGELHRDACLPTMRRHAQEHDEAVLWKHVELYVNEWTRELGPQGRAALEALGRLAAARGLLPERARLVIASA